ncbi:efflux RND transporter periplasmic adaptor subunit [Clostridium sp. 'deep sea']|uniref:efflux RND transporter periplasmic adaptor subunit n=1 Tax=Clostridium sp. 'deep sea' TaxID=2779445 RepID=UPI0018967115|nr:efflux RND transporter periplasmic adaptor subunit [Clostridium sp. 'deep sea']QOR36619.1 efflux RND transporter periplasmic adaptor subunit [Clostridium sp. 'deep sea']
MKKLTKKTIIIIVVVAIIAVIGVSSIYKSKSAKANTNNQQAQALSTVPVTIRDLQSTIYASGAIKPKKSATILAETSGVVAQILVKAGDSVVKGQEIAYLEVADLKEQIKQKEISYKIDKNNYQQAKQNAEDNLKDSKDTYEEKKALYAVDSISKNELDNAKEQYDDAKAELDINVDDNTPTTLEIKYLQYQQSESNLNNLYKDLAAATIKSPMTGVVTNVKIAETSYVNNKSPLFEVAVLDELEITTTVGEYDVNKLQVGMPVIISGDAFNNQYTGEVSNIAAAATKSGNETVVDILIDIKDETQELKPNFTANADIVVSSVEAALTVPIDTVIKGAKGENMVRLKDGEEFKLIKVETGVESDLYIQIISDEIKEGDLVVSGAGAATNKQAGFMLGGGKRSGGR